MSRPFCFLAVFLFFVTALETAFAIPAFARKYAMSCQTCHSAFPKLKPYGEDFAGNGFQLADKEAPRYYMETGDESLSLLRDIPLALRMEGHFTANRDGAGRSDFSSPYILKLLSGGPVAPDISYYFYFFFSERGSVAGIEDAFLYFNNIFDRELDVTVGQFQVSDPLFKNELRLSLDAYHIYGAKPGLSNIDLKYDRGVILSAGFVSGTDIAFEVLNGNGIGAAGDFELYDTDMYKNVMARVSQEISPSFRVGAFAYQGKEALNDSKKNFTNEVTMFGPDFTFTYKDRIELNGIYISRKDAMPGGTAGEVKTQSALAELIVTPRGDESTWFGGGLFNWVQSGDEGINHRSASAFIGHLLRRNIKLHFEGGYNFTHSAPMFSAGIVTAF